jgi:hypothetical protein
MNMKSKPSPTKSDSCLILVCISDHNIVIRESTKTENFATPTHKFHQYLYIRYQPQLLRCSVLLSSLLCFFSLSAATPSSFVAQAVSIQKNAISIHACVQSFVKNASYKDPTCPPVKPLVPSQMS